VATQKTAKPFEMPRACPVEFHDYCSYSVALELGGSVSLHGTGRAICKTRLTHVVTASVSLHGARPWHPKEIVHRVSVLVG